MRANYYDFYLKNLIILKDNLLNFHWNVTGENFIQLHNWYGEQYNDVILFIDKIAENIKYQNDYPNVNDNSNNLILSRYESRDYKNSDSLKLILKDYTLLENLTTDYIVYSQTNKDYIYEDTLYEIASFISNKIYFIKQILK